MKKKFALGAFIAVCTIILTAGIASFTLGMSGKRATTSDSGGNLSDIYNSFLTQVQHIIDNSNLTGDYSTDITHYHIVQIVDSKDAVDSANKKLSQMLADYVNDSADEQNLTSGNFRTDVIGKDMKCKHIDVETYVASDSQLAAAIRKADLIYIAGNAAYTSSNDLTADALTALETYALSEFKPVLIDSDVVGVSENPTELDKSHSTVIYDYLNKQKNLIGSPSDDHGVFSLKKASMSWQEYFDETNKNSSYVPFNNKGNLSWNKFADDYKFKVLEIVPNEAAKNSTTAFETIVNDGTFGKYAFYSEVPVERIAYVKMTAKEFNEDVAAAVAAGKSAKESEMEYDFIYISHESNDKIYFYEDTSSHQKYDFTADSISALKGFSAKRADYRDESLKGKTGLAYVDRLMVDDNFFQVYSYSNGSSVSGNVDTSTKLYQFAVKLISPDAKTTYVKNTEISSRGFFGSMNETKAKQVTDLINRSTYRNFSASNSTSFNVLEIQPYYSVDDTKWFSTKQDELSNVLENPTYQEVYQTLNKEAKDGVSGVSEAPYYKATMTQARIAAATGLSVNQIKVTSVSANALSSTSPNLLEDYDMIYIGNNHETIQPITNWKAHSVLTAGGNQGDYNFISMDPTDLENYYFYDNHNKPGYNSGPKNNAYVYPSYSHTGDFVSIYDTNDAAETWNGERYYQSLARLNGNDITAKVYAQLYNYIKSGMPVICDKTVLNTDYLIGGASANAELEEDADYKIKVNSRTTLNRLKLKATKNDNDTLHYDMQGQHTLTYRSTRYADNTTKARKESEIDPESYMYQLLYKIAVQQDSGIYHANNVMVGFDSTDLVKNNNIYRKGITSDSEETVPEDIEDEDYSNKEAMIADLEKTQHSNYKMFDIFSNKIEKTLLGAVDYKKSGAGIQMKHFLNEYAANRPVINLISAPVEYDSERDLNPDTRIVNSKDPTFSFSLSGATGATYHVKLYYDFDGDGKYSDDRTEGRLEGSEYDSEVVAELDYTVGTDGIVVLKSGSPYIKSAFKVDSDFVGVLPYKLVAEDTATGKKTSVVHYPKYYSNNKEKKQTIRLLQIIPGYESGGLNEITHKVTTLCANENTIGNGGKVGSADHNKHEFGIVSASNRNDNLASRLSDEYNIELTILTTGQFSEAASLYIQDYCQHFDTYKVRDALSAQEITDFQTFMSEYYNSSSKKMNAKWESLISWDNTTFYNFNKLGICDKIFAGWLSKGDVNSKLELQTKDYNGNTQKIDMGYYDMVVFGFAHQNGGDVYRRSDITNVACQFIRTYVANKGSILLGSDTTSWRGFESAGDQFWSRNINKYLRGCFGMDRFKFTEENVASSGSQSQEFYSRVNGLYAGNYAHGGRSYLFTPYTSNKFPDTFDPNGQTYPGEFFTKNSYDGTYENASADKAMSGAGETDSDLYGHGTNDTIYKDVKINGSRTDLCPTTRVARNNTGLITSYPFNLGSHPKISKTASQFYSLDTEDNDMNIWYTLAGATDSSNSQIYAADPYNGRSYYYIYTYKTVTYTGAGYSAIAEATGNDDERKLIINTIIAKTKIHRGGPRVEFSNYTGSEPNDSKVIAATGTEDAILECKTKKQTKCNFDFTVSTARSRTLTDVKMFIDNNNDGEYNDGDFIIKDYGNKVVNEEKVIVSGKDLPAEIGAYMQQGPFTITVSAVDSDGQKGYARLLVKTKSKLFNLN